mgnify:CR=1 FL=1
MGEGSERRAYAGRKQNRGAVAVRAQGVMGEGGRIQLAYGGSRCGEMGRNHLDALISCQMV